MALLFGDDHNGHDRGEEINRLVWSPRANHTLPMNGDKTMATENGTKKGGLAETNGSATPRVERLFKLGEVYLTRGALELPSREVIQGLRRHASGDWGNLELPDWRQNELALQTGERLLSAYRASNGQKFWIITEWDRSITTVLLPNEY